MEAPLLSAFQGSGLHLMQPGTVQRIRSACCDWLGGRLAA
jgi:hypothetical protein